MLNDKDFNNLVSYLQSDSVGERSNALKNLSQFPTGDPRILPYLEALLEDRAIAVVGIPIRFGEVRWLARYALRAERGTLDIHEPVTLPGTFWPLSTGEIGALAENAGIDPEMHGIPGVIETLGKLLDRGVVPLVDLELDPRDRVKKG